jgi:hypothetical protein
MKEDLCGECTHGLTISSTSITYHLCDKVWPFYVFRTIFTSPRHKYNFIYAFYTSYIHTWFYVFLVFNPLKPSGIYYVPSALTFSNYAFLIYGKVLIINIDYVHRQQH